MPVAVPPILLANPLVQSLQILWKQSLISMYLRSRHDYSTTVSGKQFTIQFNQQFYCSVRAVAFSHYYCFICSLIIIIL